MKRFVKSVLIAAVIFIVATSSASAATVIDFLTGGGGPGGTVSVGANITGSGIFIDTVTIIDAPANNGSFDVEGAGACLDAIGGCGVLSFDKNLNTISIVGSIPALGILAPINLLSGNLSGGVTVSNDVAGLTGISASGADTKALQLLSAVGLDAATQFGFFGFETHLSDTGMVISTDITNTGQGGGGGGQPATPVPEPGSLVLFGTGLLGLASGLRRRFANRNRG